MEQQGSSWEDRVTATRRTSAFKENNAPQHEKRNDVPREVPKPTTISREVKLERHLEQVRIDLEKANAKINELMQSSEDAGKLQKTIEVLSANNTRLTKDKEELELKLTEGKEALELKLTEETRKRSSVESELKVAKEEVILTKEELNACRTEMLKLRRRLAEKETQLNEANNRCHDFETQVTELSAQESKALKDLQRSSKESLTKGQTLSEENSNLRQQAEETAAALEAKCKECLDLQDEGNALRRRLDRPVSNDASVQTELVQTSCIEIQTEPVRDFETSSIVSERLTMIREATERTGVFRQHQDELSLLAEDHERAIQELERQHTKRVREMEEQASDEQATKIQQLRRSLKTNSQKQMDEMSTHHRKELSKLRKDNSRKLGQTTASLEVALDQVKASTEQLEGETRIRTALAAELEKLQRDYKEEKATLLQQHHEQVEALRAGWEEERTSLLDEIQQGCNQVILDSRRVLTPSSTTVPNVTPSSAVPKARFDFRLEASNKEADAPDQLSPNSQTSSGSTVSQSLAETEAFVLKVLGTSCL